MHVGLPVILVGMFVWWVLTCVRFRYGRGGCVVATGLEEVGANYMGMQNGANFIAMQNAV